MKIVCVENVFGEGQTYVGLRPDTSVLRNNDDFYMPHFSTDIVCGCGVMVRITRLAKCLDARFASRCYDAVGVGVTFVARDVMQQALSAGRPCDEAYSFDRSVAVSPQMKDPSEVGEGIVEMSVGERVVQKLTIAEMRMSIDECVSRASQSPFVLSFIPPAQIATGSTTVWYSVLFGGAFVVIILPFIIYSMRKPEWRSKMAVIAPFEWESEK